MTTPIEKKYRETLETIFEELAPENQREDTLDALLQPLRIYAGDIARFHTAQIFKAKFRQFLEARDRIVILSQDLEHRGLSEEAFAYQQEVNQILDQILGLLSRGLEDSDKVVADLDIIIEKVKEAKSINSVRVLGETLLDAGRSVRESHHSIREGLAKLSEELTRCRGQIEDLEDQLGNSQQEADRDRLTHLLLRRAFDRDLREAIGRAHRFENPLCLLLVDLDDFVAINEDYGQQVGDDVLVNFAKLLVTSLRDFDLTYRLGGDEFAVLFTGCTLNRAQTVAERVRKYLAEHRYRVDGHDFRLTISGGLVALALGESETELFKRADELLQKARAEGNQIIAEKA